MTRGMARVIWEKLVKKQILYGEGGSVLLPSLFAVLEQAAKRSRQRPHRKGKSVAVHRGIILLKVLHFIILLYIIDDTLI